MKILSRYAFSWMLVCSILLFHAFALQAGESPRAGLGSPAAQIIDKPFYEAVESSHQLADRLQDQINGFYLIPQAMKGTWQKVVAEHSSAYPFLLITQIGLVILAGLFFEFFLRRRLRTAYVSISDTAPERFLYKLMRVGLRVALEVVFLSSFVMLTFILYVFIFPETGIAATIASSYLLGGYYIRILFFLLTVFLSPSRPFLRILPFTEKVARSLFVWSFSLCFVEIFLARSGIIMKKSGADESVLLAVIGLIIVSTTVMLTVMILQSRQRVSDALCPSSKKQQQPASLTCQLAGYWHLPVMVFLFSITAFWEIRVLESGKIHFGKIIIGLLAIPIFFSLDMWGRRLLQIVLIKSGARDNMQGALLGKICADKYVQHIQLTYRALLLALLIFFFLGLFRIDVALGRMFTAGVLSSILIVILIYLSWQFFTGWVDRRIREEIPDDEEADHTFPTLVVV